VRVSHVHLKDVDANVARGVLGGDLSYAEGVKDGLYRPLGDGDLDIEEVVGRMQDSGYRGWYVLEQDTALTAEPDPAHGPLEAARESLEYFRRVISAKQHITAVEGGLNL
jgi:sugar phosphate isomerase/epimerase